MEGFENISVFFTLSIYWVSRQTLFSRLIRIKINEIVQNFKNITVNPKGDLPEILDIDCIRVDVCSLSALRPNY